MVSLIAAVAPGRVIGKDNSLPWHIPEERGLFRKLTAGCTVIMGRKTFESLPAAFRPLPNRHTIVISRKMPPQEGVDVCRSIEETLKKAKDALEKGRTYNTHNAYNNEIFIIGGESVYAQTIHLADKLYISWIHGEYSGNKYFPEIDARKWEIHERKEFRDFTFMVYQRRLAIKR